MGVLTGHPTPTTMSRSSRCNSYGLTIDHIGGRDRAGRGSFHRIDADHEPDLF
ncbi:hypothetical protein [Kribbella sp. NPDC006257]|uniref:hypothetical protein n=1 Tax=Kribbella sp. NPDC006257 TaxID=3156738 RepID=UPI00339DF57E